MEKIYWSTENSHSDNSETMQDFLNNHLKPEFELIYQDGSYAEVVDKIGNKYSLSAFGNGDSFNHVVNFILF